jgi:hypothetical protein
VNKSLLLLYSSKTNLLKSILKRLYFVNLILLFRKKDKKIQFKSLKVTNKSLKIYLFKSVFFKYLTVEKNSKIDALTIVGIK